MSEKCKTCEDLKCDNCPEMMCPKCGKHKWINGMNCLECNKETIKGLKETRSYCLKKMKRFEDQQIILKVIEK